MKKETSFIPWWRIQYTEADVNSVTQAIRAEHISLGPLTARFEAELAEKLQVPYVVATTSGSMALLMSLIALKIGPGDEVIIPNRTWIAAAHAAAMVGAKVVLVDVLAQTPIIDVAKLEEAITSRTKAVIPTALSGRAVNIQAIKTIAQKHGIKVIEDAAQATFSREDNHFAGTEGDIGCFSLSVAKLLPTGQGGFLATKNEHLYHTLKTIRTHGVADLLHCAYQQFGFNFRFTDLQASIGLSQLATLTHKTNALKEIYQSYQAGLKYTKKVSLIPVDIEKGEVPLYIEVLCSDREKLVAFLQSRDIQVKVFYPNLNRATYLACAGDFPHADQFEAHGVTLPCGPDQSLENIERVITAIHEYENIDNLTNLKEAAH